MATALMGEHCDKGHDEDGSMEQEYVRLRISPVVVIIVACSAE